MTNRPLSTALQHRIAENIIDVYERGDCVALPQYARYSLNVTSYLNERPWTSVDWACCWVCPLNIGRNIASVRIDFSARVFREVTGGGLANPSMEFELRAGNFSQRLTITESTARYRPYSITLNLPPNTPSEIQVSLWLRDPSPVLSGGSYDLGVVNLLPRNLLLSSTGLYVNATGSQPNTGSMDLFATSPPGGLPITLNPDTATPVHDHIRLNNALSPNQEMGVYPKSEAVFTAWLRPLSYAQVRAMAVTTKYTGASLYTPGELRPNIPEVSEVAQKHIRIQDEIYLRPGLLSAGSPGDPIPDTSAGWPTSYRAQWAYVKGNDTPKDIAAAIAPCFAPENWTARFLFVGTHSVANSGSTDGDTITEILPRAADATWELDVGVFQTTFKAGGIVRFDVKHYPVDTRLTSRFLYQQYWAQRIDFSKDNYFTYREGLLYREDFDFVQEVAVPIDGTGIDWAGGDIDFELPITFRANLERVTSVTPTYRQGTAAERVPDNLRLVLVGMSIHRERFFA